MAADAEIECDKVTGNAAPWVAEIYVYVDGQLVDSPDHAVTDDGPWWSWTVDVDLEGEHTVRVTDRPAVGGEFLVAERTLSCPVTTTTSAPETSLSTPKPPDSTVPAPTTTVSVSPSLAIEPQRETATTILAGDPVDPYGPCHEDGTCQPGYSPATIAVTQTTLAETVATLPATGSTTAPLVGAGLGFLVCGVVAVFVARRKRVAG